MAQIIRKSNCERITRIEKPTIDHSETIPLSLNPVFGALNRMRREATKSTKEIKLQFIKAAAKSSKGSTKPPRKLPISGSFRAKKSIEIRKCRPQIRESKEELNNWNEIAGIHV
jgi:hypothetical protein